jgi:hypothetical protein
VIGSYLRTEIMGNFSQGFSVVPLALASLVEGRDSPRSTV